MNKPLKFDESGDSADLQTLFDSIAAGSPPTPMPPEPDPAGDSPDLQALFDNVSSQVAGPSAAAHAHELHAADNQEVVFNRIGQLTRKLHDSLRELGYDKALEDTARQIPDAQERLKYIAKMTEQAASRVLNACDVAKPTQADLDARIRALGTRWDKMFANALSVDEFKQLAADTRTFFAVAPTQVGLVSTQLDEIMLAQDFQDLTGQVIKRVVEVVQGIEGQLVQVLIEVMPDEKKAATSEGLMNGPVINATGRADVLTSQQQVDDLLESLGF